MIHIDNTLGECYEQAMEKVAFIDMSRVEDVWSVSFRALEKST